MKKIRKKNGGGAYRRPLLLLLLLPLPPLLPLMLLPPPFRRVEWLGSWELAWGRVAVAVVVEVIAKTKNE